MEVTTYADAEGFLSAAETELASNLAAHGLIAGICLRLIRYPERVEAPPCLKTVQDERGLVLVAMMTPPHKLIVYGHRGDLDRAACALVESLISEGWRVPGALGPADVVGPFVDRWRDITGQRCELERQLRAYVLRSVKSPVPERGRLRLAAAADLERVAEWRYRFDQAIFGTADRGEARRAAERGIEGGDIYLWEEDGPVSMALKTRPARDGISVSAVYTPPELRRRGCATACVGELSRLLLASGWDHCTLFVDVTNAAAECVYRKVGYEPVCDFDEVVFLRED